MRFLKFLLCEKGSYLNLSFYGVSKIMWYVISKHKFHDAILTDLIMGFKGLFRFADQMFILGLHVIALHNLWVFFFDNLESKNWVEKITYPKNFLFYPKKINFKSKAILWTGAYDHDEKSDSQICSLILPQVLRFKWNSDLQVVKFWVFYFAVISSLVAL